MRHSKLNKSALKNIPISAALPTHGYVVAFIIVTIIICFINYTSVKADIKYVNDALFMEHISDSEAEKLLSATIANSLITGVFACLWGIFLNILFRRKTWCWRWELIYIISSTVMSIIIVSLTNGELTAGSVGLIWWFMIILYRYDYVRNRLINDPRICTQNTVPSAANDVILPAFCLSCGKAIVPNSKFCINCGSPTENSPAIVESPPVTKTDDITAYTSAYASLSLKLTEPPLPNRIDTECKALFSYLHHVKTRSDKYDAINTELYERAFGVLPEELDLYNSRLSDYLEIDLNDSKLPFKTVFFANGHPSSTDLLDMTIRIYKYSDYIYAFIIFVTCCNRYVNHIKYEEAMKFPQSFYKNLANESTTKKLIQYVVDECYKLM